MIRGSVADASGTPSYSSELGAVSLIELLIVIVILVITAAIAIPVFLTQTTKARIASAESLMRNMAQGAAIGFVQRDSSDTTGTTITDSVNDMKPANVVINTPGSGAFSPNSKTVIAQYSASEDVWRAAVWATDSYCTKVAYGAIGGGIPVTAEVPQQECTITSADIGTLIPIPIGQSDFFLRGFSPFNGSLVGSGVVWVNGQARMVGTNQLVFANTSSPALSNGIFSAKMQVGQNREGVGMVFRASNTTPGGLRGYSFQIDPGLGNRFALYQWEQSPTNPTGAREVRLHTVPFPPGFDPRAANDMRLEVNGNQLKVFANNGADPVFEYQLPADGPMGTQYGFRSWGGDSSDRTPNTASDISVTPFN